MRRLRTRTARRVDTSIGVLLVPVLAHRSGISEISAPAGRPVLGTRTSRRTARRLAVTPNEGMPSGSQEHNGERNPLECAHDSHRHQNEGWIVSELSLSPRG